MWPGAQLSSLPERHAQAFAAGQALNLKVGRAWAAIKEALRTLWTFCQEAAVSLLQPLVRLGQEAGPDTDATESWGQS